MGTRALVLLFILAVGVSPAFASVDVTITNEFANVKTGIVCGDYQPTIEPDKAYIIGELARRLALELGYTQPIFLSFGGYGASSPPEYLVSFDDSGIKAIESWEARKALPESPGIVIRQYSGPLTPAAILTLLEYAINNVATIQTEQRLQTIGRNWRVNSIDRARIQEVLGRPVSPAIERIWQRKVAPPEAKSDKPRNRTGVCWGFEKGLFVAHTRNWGGDETPLLSVKDMYDFKELSLSGAIVFDTKESFYYVQTHGRTCSRRHVIENTRDVTKYFGRYDVAPLGYDGGCEEVAICFRRMRPPPPSEQTEKVRTRRKSSDRILIYSLEHDDVIQDLDEVFDARQAKVSDASSEQGP